MPAARPAVTIATRDYDYVAPLALGDVRAEGVELTLLRPFDALARFRDDPAIHGGEVSFSQYLRRITAGDRSLVGLPVFIMREFRHRCFFVRRDSDLAGVEHLRGRRVGTDSWGASGNTWSRAILRDRGVPLDSIMWMVGPVDPAEPAHPGHAPAPVDLPEGVRPAPAGRSLGDLLLSRDLDALMCPWPPRAFHEAGPPIRRLYPDFRAVEAEYYRRTGLFPAHHIVAFRRAVVERHPGILASLQRAFTEAYDLSQRNHAVLHESSPWLLADLEESAALLGPGYRPYGYRENRAMVAAFCEEQLAQGLIREPLDPDALFEDFERLGS